jgi:SAM-dependent methyltransferase
MGASGTASAKERLRRTAYGARNELHFLLGQIGLAHSPARLTTDAGRHWLGTQDDRWRNDSHRRDGSQFGDDDLWSSIGAQHLELFERLRRTTNDDLPLRRIVEWGCGGGANAVTFAPLAEEFVGVDVVADNVDECRRQVEQACKARFVPVVADLDRPESAVGELAGTCDLFLCLYVLELVPTPAYGLRLMRIAHELLRPGGSAFVQIKYATGAWRTRARRRHYRSAVAGTTYRIEDFWTAAEAIGFRPEVVTLVPENELDSRYAYLLLTKPLAQGTD